MTTIKISKEYMLDEVLGSDDVVRDEIVGTRRWSIDHEIIFKHEGKLYRTNYSVGATESQDEGPWEYETNGVECTEVEAFEKSVTDYRDVA